MFVHGWSCDGRYWRMQTPHFSKNHRVAVLDLAGHGHSGMGRTKCTMAAFGEDVRAVGEAVGSRRAILIGHSMGGAVIAATARLMPDRVFEKIRVPVVTVNGGLWPINYEANRRHMFSYRAIVLKKADHFLMLDRPEEFNRALEEAIRKISEKPAKPVPRT